MAVVHEFDPYKLSSPRVFLLRMLVFCVLSGFLVLILHEQIRRAFLANPGLNGLIFGVLFIGIVLAFRQVIRLFREVRWVNDFRVSDPGLALRDAPILLAPMASLLGNRLGRASISTMTLRSILDSVGTRLDEARDIGRYLTGLLVFLGLLGTFWGLLETVSSVGSVISGLSVQGDTSVVFDDLKRGLAQPLSGMGIAFSSSLFGLAGSLVLGFLDLQAGQAQNRFYNELEDWLSGTVADARIEGDTMEMPGGAGSSETLVRLTEGMGTLIAHLRAEQGLIRDWMQKQSHDTEELRRMLGRPAKREKD
jgi:hypothetical protein